MNPEKLAKMRDQVRIGGKGTARRKKKVVHRTPTTDDKKLQTSLKKLSVNTIPGIEETNMIKDDGTVIHFNNPKVQASLAANTFAISGHAETKQFTELLPSILNQLGSENLSRLAGSFVIPRDMPGSGDTGEDDDDEDVPELVENFDEASKAETGESTIKELKSDEEVDEVSVKGTKTDEGEAAAVKESKVEDDSAKGETSTSEEGTKETKSVEKADQEKSD